MEVNMDEFCQKVPKVELHAHIHGSIRTSTLKELLQEQVRLNKANTEEVQIPKGRSMHECFQLFHLIHRVVVSRKALRRIILETIEDFAKENVMYLELRSTPRELAEDNMSRADYVEEVVKVLEECHARSDLDIEVRLLLSINRNQSIEIAKETVDLALEWKRKSPFVVGLDLSGHPELPDAKFHLFESILEKARQGGLKLAVHFAEHHDEEEADRVLNFHPDRLGHACCLSPGLYKRMIDLEYPIEVCLTSNVYTLAKYRQECGCKNNSLQPCLCGYKVHPHRGLVKGTKVKNYPICLCTDDTGVLATDITNEYIMAARAFGISRRRLYDISNRSIDMIFDSSIKDKLKKKFKDFSISALTHS
jgi:adenosine deaminase